MTIDRWISDVAANTPEKIALDFGDQKLSYKQLASLIDECVGVFTHAGVTRGDRIAWYGLNHPDVFVLLFACARVGAIFVPLNWRLAEPEVAAIVANCEPRLLFYDKHFANQAQALPNVPVFAQAALSTNTVNITTAEPVKPASNSNELNTSSSKPTSPTQSQSKTSASETERQNSTASETDPILLVYTSGSTDAPKGAVLSQQSVICNARMSVEAHAMTNNDVALVMLPLFHVGGLNILATPALSVGATIILHERFDPEHACKDLERATLALSVPTILQAMMNCAQWDGLDLSSVRAMSIGSTDVPVALVESIHALGIPMPQIYGATETGPFAIYQTIDTAMNSVGSIGQAGSACDIRLVKDDSNVKYNEPGEIWVKGDNVLSEYWQNPDLTDASLQNGWFRTGDIATCDEHGYYWFTDRIKHVIISGGENIYPTEIERALRSLEGVVEVAVVGKPDTTWGEVPVAVVVTDKTLEKAEILDYLHGQLARYKHPKDVIFVDELPRNAMGKVVADSVRQLV